MSLDFDRSPDGEPTTPAAQQPVPAQQAPATTDQEPLAAPSFTPKHAAGEPMDDELTGDEPTASGSALAEPAAGEPEADELADDEPVASGSAPSDEPAAEPESWPTADEPTASGRVASGSVTGDHEPAELADDEPAAAGSAASEYVLAEPEPESEPAADEPAAAEPAAAEPAAADATASGATAYHASAAPAWDAQTADGAATGHKAGIEPVADLDGPLLSDADELRTSWPRIQAAFVDDPREAVADAAGLVEHAAQALTSALRQRQRQLRAVWDRDGMPDGTQYADSGGTAPGAAAPDGDRQAADGPDTEQLRLLIQRYRRLFDQLSR